MTLHTVSNPTPEIENEVEGDVKNLRKDFDSLKENVSSLMSHVGKFASEKAGEVPQQTRELAGEAKDKIEGYTNVVSERIREKPLAAVGIAVGVGALFAILTRR